MKKIIPISAVALFIFASSFSSAFAIHQGGKYRKVMLGSDTTYGSTRKCTAGDCKLKTNWMAGQSHLAAPRP
jgi:hypothetical protein